MSADRHALDAVSTQVSFVRPAGHSPPFAEVRRGRAFWTLWLAQLPFFPFLVTVPLQFAVHGIDLGMTRTAGGGLLTVIGGASIVGRMSVGAFSDRTGGRNSCILSLVLLAVENPRPLFATVAVYDFAHDGLFTVVSPPWPSFSAPAPTARSSGTSCSSALSVPRSVRSWRAGSST